MCLMNLSVLSAFTYTVFIQIDTLALIDTHPFHHQAFSTKQLCWWDDKHYPIKESASPMTTRVNPKNRAILYHWAHEWAITPFACFSEFFCVSSITSPGCNINGCPVVRDN